MKGYLLSISSQKLAKAASEKISRIFQLISKDRFVFLDFKGFWHDFVFEEVALVTSGCAAVWVACYAVVEGLAHRIHGWVGLGSVEPPASIQ